MIEIINYLKALPWQEWVLFAVAPLFVAVYLLEWYRAHRRGCDASFSVRRALTNFGLGGSYIVFETVAKLFVTLPICLWIYHHRLFTIEVNWWTALPIFVAVEFCYYWFHRASHRIRWFWTAHVVHHSDEAMNLSTAMRQSLLYSVTGWWLFFTPLIFLGVHPVWVFFFYALNLIYQFFIHTEAIGKLSPWIEYIFDTPSNHRAHHGRNPQYIDKNYGGVLIIFDRLFGTYVEEIEPVDYGIVPPMVSYNPIKLIFHEFIAMWKDILRSNTFKQGLGQIYLPPSHSNAYLSRKEKP